MRIYLVVLALIFLILADVGQCVKKIRKAKASSSSSIAPTTETEVGKTANGTESGNTEAQVAENGTTVSMPTTVMMPVEGPSAFEWTQIGFLASISFSLLTIVVLLLCMAMAGKFPKFNAAARRAQYQIGNGM